jgi:hypothetical protein
MEQNNLWVFGCSHSTTIWKDEAQTDGIKPYGKHLSEWFNLKYNQPTLCGYGNDSIVTEIFKNINNIKKDDLLIVQFTHFSRSAWYDTNQKEIFYGGWAEGRGVQPLPNNINNESWYRITDLKSQHPIIQAYIFLKELSKLIGFKYYVFFYEDWMCKDYEYFFKDEVDSKVTIKFGDEQFNTLGRYTKHYKLKSLKDAGELNDGHMSTESHRRVAEMIHKYINENG